MRLKAWRGEAEVSNLPGLRPGTVDDGLVCATPSPPTQLWVYPRCDPCCSFCNGAWGRGVRVCRIRVGAGWPHFKTTPPSAGVKPSLLRAVRITLLTVPADPYRSGHDRSKPKVLEPSQLGATTLTTCRKNTFMFVDQNGAICPKFGSPL